VLVLAAFAFGIRPAFSSARGVVCVAADRDNIVRQVVVVGLSYRRVRAAAATGDTGRTTPPAGGDGGAYVLPVGVLVTVRVVGGCMQQLGRNCGHPPRHRSTFATPAGRNSAAGGGRDSNDLSSASACMAAAYIAGCGFRTPREGSWVSPRRRRIIAIPMMQQGGMGGTAGLLLTSQHHTHTSGVLFPDFL
jgi:hypothetical protein